MKEEKGEREARKGEAGKKKKNGRYKKNLVVPL